VIAGTTTGFNTGGEAWAKATSELPATASGPWALRAGQSVGGVLPDTCTADLADAGFVQALLPLATSIDPSSAPVGSVGLTLTVLGNYFGLYLPDVQDGSIVSWSGNDLSTTFVSLTESIGRVLEVGVSGVGWRMMGSHVPAHALAHQAQRLCACLAGIGFPEGSC